MAAGAGAVDPARLDWEQALRWSLEASDLVRAQTSGLKQSEARRDAADAPFRPSLAVQGSYLRQDDQLSGFAGTFSPAEQTTLRLNVAYPVFRGFRDQAVRDQRSALVDSAQQARQQSLRAVALETAQAFFALAMTESDLRNLKEEHRSNQDRLSELRSFLRLGRSRATDVLVTETAIHNLEAQIALLEGQRKSQRSQLTFLLGRSWENDRDLPRIAEGGLPRLTPLSEWMETTQDRAEVRAALADLQSAEAGVRSARAGHWPSVDLGANYYFNRNVGILKDVRWDVNAQLSFPLYSGGAVSQQLEESVQAREQREILLSRARRQVDQEVETAHAALTGTLAQIARLAKAWEKSQATYQRTSSDSRRGLVTQLDVLAASGVTFQTKRAWDRARIQAQWEGVRLELVSARKKLNL
jgi:outer membrane protein